MAVYVDRMKIPFLGMLMSHMLADTESELHAMASRLGLRRSWFQNDRVPHYDVSQSKRALAVTAGAVEVSRQELVAVMRRLRG